ncbi:MAG: ion channel [Pseudomonadales bacterium]|jgi:hypothetical protein|nr:ion channel [Pseudomonadales bacterium]
MHSRPFTFLFGLTIAVYVLQAAVPVPLLGKLSTLAWLYAIWLALAANGASTALRTALVGVWTATVLIRLFPIPGLETLSMVGARGLGTLMLAICVVGIARYVLFREQVTGDTLFGAAVAYILTASAFGQLFTGLHLLYGNAFVVPEHLLAQLDANPDQLFNYFSFVTLATLGYGEVLPLHPVAQILVSIETVLGQLYVAIVIAWLVGNTAFDRTRRKDDH